MHPSVLIRTSGRDFDGFICDYVFMFFPPSFLRSWGGAVTRIRKSSQRRYSTHRSSVAAAAASPLLRHQCTRRNGPQVCTHGTSSPV